MAASISSSVVKRERESRTPVWASSLPIAHRDERGVRLEGLRGACAPRGGRHLLPVEVPDHGLSFHSLHAHKNRVRRAELPPAHDRHASIARMAFSSLSRSRRTSVCSFVKAGRGQLHGQPHADEKSHVDRAAPPAAHLLATVQERRDPHALPDVQAADSLGTVELVRAEGQEIHRRFLHVHGDLPHGLHGIRVEEDALLPAQRRELPDGKDETRLVVRPHDGDKRRAVRVDVLAKDLRGPRSRPR